MSSKKTELQKVNSKISSVQKKIKDLSAAIVNYKKNNQKKALKAAKQALKKAKKSLSTLNKKKTALKKASEWKKRVSKADKSGKYEIWITYDSNKKRMQFPVLPEKIQISYPDENDKTKFTTIEGTVTEASFEDGEGKIKVNGEYYSIANIVSIREKGEVASSSTK